MPISISVRPQPAHSRVSGSMAQSLMQGVIMAASDVDSLAVHTVAAPISHATSATCWQAPSVSPVRPPIASAVNRVKI